MADDVLPVGRFSPAPGIFVDRTINSVRIEGAMELYGPEATEARAHSVENSINNMWTRSFPDGYSVRCSIRVRYRGPGSSAGTATQIEALISSGPSHVTSLPFCDRTMTLNASEPDAFTWTPAHEFGHILGMRDRYSESIMSQLRGTFGGTRQTTAQPGYQANLMAIDGGVLESRNIGDLASETAPSPYWINDDDHVRDWISAHSTAEIRLIATSNKLRMIQTLMGGWISSEDMDAIGRICGSVTTAAEARQIQNGVNTMDFSSIGQRTQMRGFFSRMPGGWLGR